MVQTGGPLVDGVTYFDPNAPKYHLDLEKAAEHFKKAWGGQLWEKGFTFVMAMNAGFPEAKVSCGLLQENLMKVNEKFVLRLQALQWPTMLQGMFGGLLPIFQISWVPDYADPHNYASPLMYSKGVLSGFQHFSNPEIDALVDAGISTVVPAEREAIYRQLDQLYYDFCPAIMMGQPTSYRYFRDWVQGFIFNPMLQGDYGYLYNLSKGY